MKKKIKELKRKHGKLISNFSYLSILQLSNLLIPIITYPLLIKRLGGFSYGKVVYAQAIMTYLGIIVNFGFNIVGTKEVSLYRNNKKKLSKIVSGIYQLKFFLFVLVFFLFSFYYLIFNSIENDFLLYSFSLWVCLYEFLFPVWYFQGMEKMKNIVIISIVNKLFVLFSIIFFIHDQYDYYYVPLINLISVFIITIISFIYLKNDGIVFKMQKINAMFFYFKKSYVLALSFSFNTIKTNFNVILAKSFFSYSAVAYFDLALKVVNIFISFLDVISQAIYPRMSLTKDKFLLQKIIKVSFLFSSIVTVILYFISDTIVSFLGGKNMHESIPILKTLIFVLPIYIVGALSGRNGLIVHGYNSHVLKSMVLSSVFYGVTLLVSIYFFEMNSLILLSIIYVLSFLVESLYRYYICLKYKII